MDNNVRQFRVIETKLKQERALQLSVQDPGLFSDILFTFLTTFVPITKLKSLFVFLSIFLTSC